MSARHEIASRSEYRDRTRSHVSRTVRDRAARIHQPANDRPHDRENLPKGTLRESCRGSTARPSRPAPTIQGPSLGGRPRNTGIGRWRKQKGRAEGRDSWRIFRPEDRLQGSALLMQMAPTRSSACAKIITSLERTEAPERWREHGRNLSSIAQIASVRAAEGRDYTALPQDPV